MQSENQKPKKNRKEKLNLVELPKEKIGVLLSLNIYDIKEKIQNVLSEVDNLSIDEEDSKKTLEKLKKSIPNSLSNTLKELKKLSNDISKLYNVNISEKEMKSICEFRKAISNVSDDNISNLIELVLSTK